MSKRRLTMDNLSDNIHDLETVDGIIWSCSICGAEYKWDGKPWPIKLKEGNTEVLHRAGMGMNINSVSPDDKESIYDKLFGLSEQKGAK